MNRRLLPLLLVFLVVSLLQGCSGMGRGMIRGSGEQVAFAFKEGGFEDDILRVALPDGEAFQGKYIEAQTSGRSSYMATDYSRKNAKPVTVSGTEQQYTGSIEGVLFGNRGHSMQCRFRAGVPGSGLSGGAVGTCTVSDGRVIDVQF